MGGTRKIFYENQYITSFDATAVSCEERNGAYLVTLDATAFYPEGGGQPADTGTLNGIKITDVQEKDGELLHYAEKPITPGTAVRGEIDWARRYEFMQQHTAEHIVSGIINKLYGLDNTGFHMGSEYTTLDTNGVLTPEQLEEVELLANRATREPCLVTAGIPSAEELKAISYRSKKALTGDVRIVTVEGYDKCACCGLHCKASAEAGPIKFLWAQKHKGGMRIFMLAGEPAFLDYRKKNNDVMLLSKILSAKPEGVVDGINRLEAEISQLKQQLAAARNENFNLILERAAAENRSKGLLHLFADNLEPDDLRRLAVAAVDNFGFHGAAVFSPAADATYKYAIAGTHNDMREYAKIINAALNGRGGGQKNLVQGSVVASAAEIEDVIGRIRKGV